MLTQALLVDDHPMFREGLALLLAHEFPHWQVLQAGSLKEAAGCLEQSPDVALVMLDLALPDGQGLDGLIQLRRLAPRPRYVVLSASDGHELILGAIDHGAAGFIPKTSQTGAMLGAMRTVLGGGVFLPPHVSEAPPGEPPSLERTAVDVLGISPRQAEVLRLLIDGKSNKAISRDLDVAESTVKRHLESIYSRLGATSRTQAVIAAARLGLRLDDWVRRG